MFFQSKIVAKKNGKKNNLLIKLCKIKYAEENISSTQ